MTVLARVSLHSLVVPQLTPTQLKTSTHNPLHHKGGVSSRFLPSTQIPDNLFVFFCPLVAEENSQKSHTGVKWQRLTVQKISFVFFWLLRLECRH